MVLGRHLLIIQVLGPLRVYSKEVPADRRLEPGEAEKEASARRWTF